MSKRTVIITLEIDATEYHEAEDNASGTIDLVLDMLRNDADLPENNITIRCESVIREIDNLFED